MASRTLLALLFVASTALLGTGCADSADVARVGVGPEFSCADDKDDDLDGETDCDDPDCDTAGICLLRAKGITFDEPSSLPPDVTYEFPAPGDPEISGLSSDGLQVDLLVDEFAQILEVELEFEHDHPNLDDVEITLFGPAFQSVSLVENQSDRSDLFRHRTHFFTGMRASGNWSLRLTDYEEGRRGTFEGGRLKFVLVD